VSHQYFEALSKSHNDPPIVEGQGGNDVWSLAIDGL